MDENQLQRNLKEPIKNLIKILGDHGTKQPEFTVAKIALEHRMQLKTVQSTWTLAILSITVSIISLGISLWFAQRQFETANRPYIGLESLAGVSTADTTGLTGDQGTTLNVFREKIKNYGQLPAYFEIIIPEKKLICVESSINQIMPEQSIELNCERQLGIVKPNDQNICDTVLREEIHIRYGNDQDHLEYETILRMRLADVPQSPSLKMLINVSLPKGCDGKSEGQIIQWYVVSST